MRQKTTAPVILLLALTAAATIAVAQRDSLEEWKQRDQWQRPQEVLDELQVRPGDTVADVGAGRGYFSFHLAGRVGSRGKVYAVDVDHTSLEELRRRATERKVANIETVVSEHDEPKLPPEQLDRILIVNSYHEFRNYQAMLGALLRALKPGGRMAIIDAEAENGLERDRYHDRHGIPAALVRQEAAAAGFEFVGERPGFTDPRWGRQRKWYFLLFRRVPGSRAPLAGGGQ